MRLFATTIALCHAFASASILGRQQGPPPPPPSTLHDDVFLSDLPHALSIADQFHIPILTPALQGLRTSKLILGNGVRVVIVSDPGIVKAGAGMAVDTGSWRDPNNALGLAHFTEHMLFMGSGEYPAEGEYDRYIMTHGGMNNAWTSSDHTLFYFNVNPQGLLGALDRFSQFFVSPNFAASALEREKNAVQSEYNMGAMQDRRRLWYVEQAVFSPTDTPFSRFGCGNLTSLASVNSTTVSDWFQAEYDPRGMHLVVYSHEPIQVLQRRVKARFSNIKFSEKWQGPVRAEGFGTIIPTDVPGSWVYVEPIKDIRTLKIMWSIPPRFAVKGNRAANVAASVLGDSGPGSILSNLKDEGLVSSFGAYSENEASDAAFIYVNADLTIEGLANVTRVVQLVFQGIGSLGKQTLPPSIIEEHNLMSTLNYMWQTRQTNYRSIATAAYALRQEDLASYPRKTLIWEYTPFDLSDIFTTHLTPNNSIIFVQAQASDTFNVTFETYEPIVGTRYTLEKISDADMHTFTTAHHSLSQKNYYPPPSPYMPNPPPVVIHQIDPSVRNLQKWEPNPIDITLVSDTDSSFQNTYIAPDMEFGVPRMVLKSSFFSPALDFGGNPHLEIIGYLWMGQVSETTEQWRSQAAAGGFSFDVGLSSTPYPRVHITVSGYSARPAVQLVLQGLYNAIRNPQLITSRIKIDLEDLRLRYENQQFDDLYKQTSRIFTHWAINSTEYNTREAILAAIDRMKSLETWEENAEQDIRELIQDIFVSGGQGFHEFTLLAGNVEDEDLKQIRDQQSNASFVPNLPYIPPKDNVFRPSFINVTDKPVFLYKNLSTIPQGRSAARLLVPLGDNTNATTIAFAELVDAVCGGQFFAALRTHEQLGYAVGSFSTTIRRRKYQGFVVQTEKLNGTATLSRIQSWVQSWIVEGLGLNDSYLEVDGDTNKTLLFEEHYNRIKDAVVQEWKSKYPSLSQKTDAQEYFLLWNRDNTALRSQTLQALMNMTRDTFRALIAEYFGATQDWRAVVLDGSKGLVGNTTIDLPGWYIVKEDNRDILMDEHCVNY